MATWTFRPAVREQIRLLIGLSGGTGAGKTKSAMELAKGLAEGKRFACIDTENGRASMYADDYDFDVVELTSPFTPDRYLEVIQAAEKAGYSVILVDSMSHEWAGEGGILDMAEDELYRMAKDDYQKRESCKMASWVKPKMAHKGMMAHLLQLRANVILCFRAEQKIEMEKDDRGKFQVVPKKSLTGLDGWIPICEKNLPFELTASFLLTADKPGVPKPIKLNQHHRAFFPLDKPITAEAGRLIGEWAKGGSPKAAVVQPKPPVVTEIKPEVYDGVGSEIISTKPWTAETTKTLLRKIESAPTEASLIGYGEIAKGAPADVKDILRDVWLARKKQLQTPQPPHGADEAVSKGSASPAEVLTSVTEEELPI